MSQKKLNKLRLVRTVASTEQQSKNKTTVFVIIAILAAIPFSMGKYIEFNSPGPYDSASNVYSAKHILNGAKIGVDEIPSAQSGTLLINILGVWFCGFNETGPKLMQMILQVAALVMMFITMRKLFGTLAASMGVIATSFYLSAPLIAKFGNVKEQYMIAFMLMGISCFILGQSTHKWLWMILSGAFLALGPTFKATGISAICAVGLFTIVQPVFNNRSWKQTCTDIGLLLTGGILSIGPIYIWLIIVKAPVGYLPYSFVWKMLASSGSDSAVGSYISNAQKLSPFSQQWPRILRYYSLLSLPIALATGAIVIRLYRMLISTTRVLTKEQKKNYDRYVLLCASWWLLDMAFVWISPRLYEQYYLPLNASGAMLGGYLIAIYRDKLASSILHKGKWKVIGLVGLICMIVMSWQIFFGIAKSSHSGTAYGEKRRGYIQRLGEVSRRIKRNSKGYW